MNIFEKCLIGRTLYKRNKDIENICGSESLRRRLLKNVVQYNQF